MELVLTTYIDADPDSVSEALAGAVAPALDAAAGRIGSVAVESVTEPVSTGLRLRAGLGVLEGSELRVRGQRRLSAVEVRVPWHADGREARTLAAATFARTVASEVAAAS